MTLYIYDALISRFFCFYFYFLHSLSSCDDQRSSREAIGSCNIPLNYPPPSQRYTLIRPWMTNEIQLNMRQDPAQQMQMQLTHILLPRAFTLLVNLQVIQKCQRVTTTTKACRLMFTYLTSMSKNPYLRLSL